MREETRTHYNFLELNFVRVLFNSVSAFIKATDVYMRHVVLRPFNEMLVI